MFSFYRNPHDQVETYFPDWLVVGFKVEMALALVRIFQPSLDIEVVSKANAPPPFNIGNTIKLNSTIEPYDDGKDNK